MSAKTQRISFQGELGANSHIACLEAFPDFEPIPCPTFEVAFSAVSDGEVELAMIPIENSTAGRVADVHGLLPESGLSIVGEYFLPLAHQLLAVRGVTLPEVRSVSSHIQALGQCNEKIRSLGLRPIVSADTAGAARSIAKGLDRTRAAIASPLAGKLYDLDVLDPNFQDSSHNTTRFIVLSASPSWFSLEEGKQTGAQILTSIFFQVRNIPAALYKAMGGFATNGVNMTKLESYQLRDAFVATRFYADIVGHPDEASVQRAFEELKYFSDSFSILGVYKSFRDR